METNCIKVMVNNVTKIQGSTTAINVLRAADMGLMPVSITPHGSYNKASVCQFIIELVNPSVVKSSVARTRLYDFGRPDVIVDHDPQSIFKNDIPAYLGDKTSYVLCSSSSDQDLKKMIEGLGVNILLLPADASEKEVLAAIRFLFQKNCEKKFGSVFTLDDLAA